MNPADVTILTAIDIGYIDKLLATYPTWLHFKPEIAKMPMRVVYDTATLALDGRRMRKLAKIAKAQADFQFVPWEGEYPSQREKMLTALTFAPESVETPWYMKIDADTVATDGQRWLDDTMFEPFDYGGMTLPPAFITNPWGYTKPAEFLDRLDDWGDNQFGMGDCPRLNIPHEPGAKRAYHSRIISWLFIGNTEWSNLTTNELEDRRLPVPSQDTFLWYCAQRGGRKYRTVNFRRRGWGHMGRTQNAEIAETCRSLINDK